MLVRDQSHNYLSPHVQVSFPVTDRTGFRLATPTRCRRPTSTCSRRYEYRPRQHEHERLFGPDLDFGKTIPFEFGIRHAFNADMVLDVAAYNKDMVSDPAARLVSLFDPVAAVAITDFRILTNLDFGNVRGLDVRLDRRFGNFFNGTVSYAYQQAKNTGSDPFTYVNYGSRIVNQIGGTNGAQPPPAGHPPDRRQPAARPGQRVLSHLPG